MQQYFTAPRPYLWDGDTAQCGCCGDCGVIRETDDPELGEFEAPCPLCRVYCRSCGRHVPKQGHQCPQPQEETP
jgi:hypothetical protein